MIIDCTSIFKQNAVVRKGGAVPLIRRACILEFDTDNGSAYVRLHRRRHGALGPLGGEVVLDFDPAGELIGIELSAPRSGRRARARIQGPIIEERRRWQKDEVFETARKLSVASAKLTHEVLDAMGISWTRGPTTSQRNVSAR